MSNTKHILGPLFIIAAVFLFSLSVIAQTDAAGADRSYDVSLQLVVGSGQGSSDVPASIEKQLRTQFGMTNPHISNTFFGRIANNGSFEYKSVGKVMTKEFSPSTPAFLEWSFRALRGGAESGVQAESFRFGARLPIITGAGGSVVNYESIGVVLGRVTLPENVPTLVGSLDLPDTGGTLFLVMTVKRVAQ